MSGFSDPVVAQKTRDVLTRLMIDVLDQERPSYQYGTVTQIDPDLGSCLVLLPADTEPVRVKYGAMRPVATGQVVRVSGNRNDRFISDVIGGAVQADRPVVDMDAPQDVTMEGFYESVTIRWSPIDGVSKYEVQFADDAGFTVLVVSYDTVANELTRRNLTPNQVVYGRVRALSSSAAGPWSASVNATVMGLPDSGTDGSPPSTSPQPVITPGIGYLLAEWLPISNLDAVTYEVHISTTSGFTATSTTKIGEVTGTHYFIRRLPDGSTLNYGTTYFVRIIAKDDDGAAPASAQGSGAPVTVGNTDVGRISTSKIGDGFPPPSSPTPSIQNGLGYLYATWTHPTNADPITYDIHISVTTGFTPSTNTLVGSTESNFAFIRKQGPGGAPANGPLAYGTTYFVKLIARDVDGQAAASGQGSGTPLQALATDIGPNQITTQHILAGSITAASAIIADAAIETAKIQDAAITTAKIGNAQITTALIGDLQVVNAKIADAAINTAKIGDLAVTNAKISDLNAQKLTAGTITGDKLAADTVLVGQVIRSSNFALGTAGWIIRGDGSAEFSNVIVRGTYKSAAISDRIEILTAPTGVEGHPQGDPALAIKFYASVLGGADPFTPGLVWSDISNATGLGYLMGRSPRPTSEFGVGFIQLQSGVVDFGNDAGAFIGASNFVAGVHPELEILTRPHQVNLYDAGNFNVFGNFNVGGGFTKNFRIPHPLFPDRELVHSTLEGPEAAVFYRGRIRVPKTIRVTLPDYFEGLCKTTERTVQATPITGTYTGTQIPQISVSEVTDGSFEVTTNIDCEVFWRVEAQRRDITLEVEPVAMMPSGKVH